jgi:hypothetical protein
MGAALVHNMKDQLVAGKEIDEIRLQLTDAAKIDILSPVADSIGVGVNDFVSVSWSKDLDNKFRDRINAELRDANKLKAASLIKQIMPKGLENGKRLNLSR